MTKKRKPLGHTILLRSSTGEHRPLLIFLLVSSLLFLSLISMYTKKRLELSNKSCLNARRGSNFFIFHVCR